MFGYDAGFYDLSQNPSFRARACRAVDPLFTFTTNCGNIWSIGAGRCLSGNEIGAAQGLPSHPALAFVLGSTCLDFNHLKRSVWSRMIGNGMSTACVSAVLAWIATYAEPSLGDVPAGIILADQRVDDSRHLDLDWQDEHVVVAPGIRPADCEIERLRRKDSILCRDDDLVSTYDSGVVWAALGALG